MSTQEIKGVAIRPDEEVRHTARPSWAAYPNTWLVTVISAITIVGLIVAIPLVVWMWSRRRGTRYVVTDERVLVVRDVLFSGRSSQEYRIEDVQYVGTGQTWLGEIVGVGSVSVATPATTYAGYGRTNAITFAGTGDYRSIASAVRDLTHGA